jgi:serine/threonine protein kinase
MLIIFNRESNKRWVFVGVAVGATALLVLSAFLLWFFCRRHSQNKALNPLPALSTPAKNESSWSVSTQGVRYAIESLTIYKFDDIQKATGFFGEANRIKGSVYRGSFMGDGAAVKVMKGDVSSEINLLKRINHTNIIRLSGFCVHSGNTYLVYEYAENGSLTDWLHDNKDPRSSPLAWKQRVQVAYDMADALNYLHNYINPPYIHKNLKTSNILLDSNLRAKISNFGLARTLGIQDRGGLQLTRHVVGTHGYMAPEYMEDGVITPKLDVFAFGVVMLELLSGREASSGAEMHGGDHEELLYASIRRVLDGDNVREKLRGFVDPSLRNEYPLDIAFSMAQLAKNCVAHDLNSRPAMPEVFMTLSKILYSSLDWDPSDDRQRSGTLGHTNGK